jgi:glycosyltransferase involved in cell wall biosynthesis
MPSLNVEPYIVECVDSVINQTLKDIEIIFVDAGSTDGTLEILKDYESKDSRIKLIVSDKKSYGHQMNLGLANATGQYIGIVETDDYVSHEMFRELYNLSNDGQYDIVKSSFIYVNEDTDEVYQDLNIYKQKIPDDRVFSLKDNPYILTGHPSIWAAIYKRKFLTLNEIEFMEAPGGGWVDNPFFHETACLAKTIRYTDDAYYYYRESNPNSSSNKLSDFTLPIERMMDNLDVFDKYPECKNEEVLKVVYGRVNIYMDNISKRRGYTDNLPILMPYIKEMMDRLDENIVKRSFSQDNLLRYYKFKSPLHSLSYGEEIKITPDEFQDIINENNFLHSYINENKKKLKNSQKLNKKLEKRNKKLEKQNDKLKKRNKKLKEINKN